MQRIAHVSNLLAQLAESRRGRRDDGDLVGVLEGCRSYLLSFIKDAAEEAEQEEKSAAEPDPALATGLLADLQRSVITRNLAEAEYLSALADRVRAACERGFE